MVLEQEKRDVVSGGYFQGHNLAEDRNSKGDTQGAELSSETAPAVVFMPRFCG